MKILCLLVTCLNPKNANCSRGIEREQQFTDGIKKFLEYKHILDQHNVKICLTDNSCDILPTYMINLLPEDIIINVKNNNMGQINKGVGLIWQWKQCQDIIKEYDYVIHFEPRQLFMHFDFINSFLSNPRNLVNLNKYNRTFNTGLMCIDAKSLIKYIDNTNTVMMVERYICIEGDMLEFFIKENISFDDIESMGIIWYDRNKPVIM